MKILFFISVIVVATVQSFAAEEEVLFSCVGGKTSAGVVPLYKVESLRNGRWISTVEAQGVISEGDLPSDVVTISKQAKKGSGCVLKLDQNLQGKPRTFDLVYADKELTLKDTVVSNFTKAPCKVISKKLRAQLEACDIKDREEVSQGLLCRSDPVDETEIHIRIDSNKDVSYTERAIFQVYQGKATKLGTRSSEVTSSLIDDGNTCVVTVTESNETPEKRLRLVIRLKKPFTEAALGRVEVSKVSTKNENGKVETVSLPDHFKNMKCEFMGDLAGKIAECNVDTIEASTEASPKSKKSTSTAPQEPTVKVKGSQ